MAEMATEPVMTQQRTTHASPSLRVWLAVATAIVLALGAVEGWYGKTAAGDVYGSDAIQYLDIAHAFERGDLHSALNPLWSQGYPVLLALVRPAFAAGNVGEWNAIRSLNFAIFALSWGCFCAFARELLRGRRPSAVMGVAGVCVFVTMQICMDQVSRVGPDQLVSALFFVVCALLLRIQRGASERLTILLALTVGVGFIVKSIFLPLGCLALVIAALEGLLQRQRLKTMLPAVAVFGCIVLGYGAALTYQVGSPTLGEAGPLNYAWHVNRLAKWVHWEGGVDPADKAWPKPWIARFAHWQSDPPDFGRPIHPSRAVGVAPTVYVFEGPVQATYVPYFDPPYWYQGYRHLVRWRYQVIALGKNLGDLVVVLVKQPLVWAFVVAWIILWGYRPAQPEIWLLLPAWLGRVWPVLALALAGIAIYLPVHLEGRYLSAFLAVSLLTKLDGLTPVFERSRLRAVAVVALLAVGCLAGLVKDQREVWSRAVHHWNYRDIPEWREGEALRAEGLAPDSEIAVISWTPNVQCDWAYLAGMRITSEIASPADEKTFWSLRPEDANAVLLEFRQAGAMAVVTREMPAGGAPGWHQLGSLPMWVYRF